MTEGEILRELEAAARERLDWERPLKPSMRLVEDLALDSLKLLALAIQVENRFQVRLEEDEEAAIETVGDLVGLVRRKLESAGG